MVGALLATCILGQNNNYRIAEKPCVLSAPYGAVFDKLAGHGFAGSEVIIELDPSETRHWKAAIWIHTLDDMLMPIAEQVVIKGELDFHLLPFGKNVSEQVGKFGKETDRKAWLHAKFALPKADNLDWSTRVVFILYQTGTDGKLSDEILANREVDILGGLTLATFPSKGGVNFIPIGRDGSVTSVLRPCLGGPPIPEFGTPGFPKSH